VLLIQSPKGEKNFQEENVRKRVVITGLGCISSLGLNVNDLWENIIQGKSGIRPITRFDTEGFRTKIAAEVNDFDPVAFFGSREARRMDRFSQFAVAATLQAVENAQLKITEDNQDRIGVVIGTAIGGIGTLLEQVQVFNERGPSKVSPFLVPMMLPDTGPGMVAIQLGVRGPNLSVVTACATGTNSIGEATEIIRRGQSDVIIAGGSEAAIVSVAMAGLSVMGATSMRNDEPEQASRPFDRDRDGFVMGEGAGICVLESLEHAQARGAKILAELTGYGSSCDAYHISAPAENGIGASRCMQSALDNAGLRHEQIDYINAHGTSTPLNDKSETAAIKSTFGELAYKIPTSSTKSMTGHLLGAAGALEAIIGVKVLENQILPPTINYQNPDPECDLDYVPNQSRKQTVQHIMSNSFGFGGHNATIILSQLTQ